MRIKIKSFILDLFFPKFCLGCQKEGNYLCQDCLATLEISQFRQKYSTKNLTDLYFALPYQNPLIKNLIQRFKYEPFIKELAKPLSSLIINHFQLLDKKPDFFYPIRDRGSSNGANFILIPVPLDYNPPTTHTPPPAIPQSEFVLIPVPLDKKRLRWRGFNQAEELAKGISKFLNIEILNNILIKTKETLPQVELSDEERKENIKGAFACQNQEKIKGRKILLVDDIYTTGSTMEECARVLKKAGAKEIIGIVVARG